MATPGNPTILVVENDHGLRSLLADVLELEGYRVLEASDGIRAVRLLAEERVDAVLLDIRLDLEDGIALGQELRFQWPDLPIAFMSGDSSGAEAAKRAESLGSPFLSKPFTPDGLTTVVEQLLGRG